MPQQTLHDFVLNLLTNPQAMKAFQLDPEAVLEQAGLADLCPQDVQEAIPLVMDCLGSSLSGSLAASLDSVAGSGILATPLGDFAAAAATAACADGGPAGVFGLFSPLGAVIGTASPAGLSMSAVADFSALSDLSDTLDCDALGGEPTGAVVDGSDTGTAMVPSGLTGGANSAASLLTAGASATAGLVGTGADLAPGLLTDPAGAAETTALSSVTAVNQGTLPVDVAQEVPISIPVIGGTRPDVVQDVSGKAPADDLAGHLPVDVDHPMDIVDGVHQDVLDAVNQSPASGVLEQTGANDVVSHSPLADVVSQSPVPDVISLTQPGGATELVGDVVSLDEQLPF